MFIDFLRHCVFALKGVTLSVTPMFMQEKVYHVMLALSRKSDYKIFIRMLYQ